MKSVKTNYTKRIWKSNKVECTWAKNGVLDLGQKTNFNLDPFENNYLLDENDLNFMPTQEQLAKNNYWTTKELYNKFYLPKFAIRTVVGGKVVGSEYKLRILGTSYFDLN